MQQEDDLRALAKIMEFGRAVSIFLLVVHVYVYCYPSITAWNLNLEVTDRILVNFNNTTGIFNCILWTKLLAVTLLAISCLGTHGVKGEKITWPKIYAALVAGCVLFFLNWWLLDLSLPHMTSTILYVITLTAGYLGLLMAGLWMSRLYRHNLMDDVFNIENESFQQETRLLENEYSVNLPTSFRFQGKQHDGWINVVNPFRATIVLGTPGSGKSYAVVNNYIRQMISKGYSCYIYDYKFDDLSTIAYNTLLNNMDKYEVKPRFYVINFDDPRRSHRCNPINPEFMTDISDAYEASYTIMLNLNRTWIEKQGDFFVESPIILLAAIIWYLKIYKNGIYCSFPHAKQLGLFRVVYVQRKIVTCHHPIQLWGNHARKGDFCRSNLALELVLGAPFPGVHEGGKVVFQLRIRGQDGKQIRIRLVEQLHRVRKGTINAVFVNL